MEIHVENIYMMSLCFRTAGVDKLHYKGKKKKERKRKKEPVLKPCINSRVIAK
jgi:hypothetical protein